MIFSINISQFNNIEDDIINYVYLIVCIKMRVQPLI
ncbi:hypothetical protein M2105_000066 [Paenibacillus sp. PastF-1]|nr:hypothetical protein [Paenibacillus sp. PastF-2]MDF9845652.1 hypothetical protein [Paenibacillus sp. PastM-2]MDF9852224.1 hypothetical protein [Paenibacillus sp. PastF-1]MDH6478047.1 hypothetical protein [Paenibacillus sp. PastH-2]MDH6505782.1 hypothetical protein [Paenibacillus sp. PastM-3]